MAWIGGLSGRRGDGVIAAVTTAATLGPLLVSGPKAWWIVALGVVASAPVYWRRRAPMTVALLVGAAMSVMVFWEKPFLPFGPLVAVHTIADRSPAWQRLAAIPAIAAVVGVSLALPGEDSETFRLVGIAFVAAYALGTTARASPSRTTELTERARRLEQEHVAEAGPVVVRSDPLPVSRVLGACRRAVFAVTARPQAPGEAGKVG
ncbi:hypothetical protein [Nonomuraea sp. NPDC023979]|uniref:DUF7134 domain-containing protein n=1 Tax=Nonomuraea sp. NPDC023979 TaxID=3154796 RepID=UPI0033C5ADE3